MFHEVPLHEWNRFAPWELFCSAFRAQREAEAARSPLERLHHNRAMLLFAFAYLEALLNYAVSRVSKGEDVSEFVRKKKLIDKLKRVGERTRRMIRRDELDKVIKEYQYLRNEIVHPKRNDQQPQFHVQHINPSNFISLLQKFSLGIFAALGEEFPYWLTGWNYTGFNGNWSDLFLSNNGNGFAYSLMYMGFRFRPLHGAGNPSFGMAHMTTAEHFEEIQGFLAGYPEDREPLVRRFPMRPRLVKTWWSRETLRAVEEEVMAGYRALADAAKR